MALPSIKTKIFTVKFKVFNLYKGNDRKNAHPKIILCFLHILLLNDKIKNQKQTFYIQVANS